MREFKIWLMLLMSSIILAIIGISLWRVWAYIPILGAIILISVGIAFVAGVGIVILYLVRVFYHADVIHVEQHGAYIRRFNTVTPLPPLNTITPKVAMTKVTELSSEFPRLGELIADGSLVREIEGGALEMFQGFREDGTRRYGTWPGVIGIGGGQNVGKSVTLLTLVVISLIQGAKVVVCDVHWSKPRSLYKKLEVLEGLVTFAKTYEEVGREAEAFSQELAARKRGSDPYPYVFVLDEAASVIKRSEVGKQVTEVIEEASQEGHGYNLAVMLACHDWSQDGLGDVRIRDYLNWVYNHRMSDGLSKFIFKDKKHQKRIMALPSGHTLARDEYSQVEYLIMPMGDSRDALLARKAVESTRLQRAYNPQQVTPPMEEMPMCLPETPRFIERESSRFKAVSGELRTNTENETDDFSTYEGRKTAIAKLRAMNMFKQSEIIQRVYSAKPGETEKYKNALAEYKRIVEELMATA